MRVKEFVAFIKEREAIRVAKEAGQPRGLWTKDPILAKYRFCNVRREDDRVTRELKDLAPTAAPYTDDLWFWWFCARLFNKPETMAHTVTHDWLFLSEVVRRNLKRLRQDGPIFNGAYIVSTNGKAMDKVDYIIDLVLKPLWKDRKSIRPTINDTLDGWHQKLMMYDGLGSFMAAQVVADMKYVAPLNKASDWWTFAASGPGSRRGLNRVLGVSPAASWKEENWRRHVGLLQTAVNEYIQDHDYLGPRLSAQDIQNCLCEFDKYERARLGEGTPKQIYKEK